jgi:hypothetical protein
MGKDVKNIDMIYVLVILILFLVTPIRVVITKDETKSDIDFYFTRIFNLRLDFDEFIKALFTEAGTPEKISPAKIIRTYQNYNRFSPFIRTATRMTSLDKITLVVRTGGKSLERQTWNFVFSWILIAYFQNLVHGYFKSVKDEYYNQVPAEKTAVLFELRFNFRLIYLVFSGIKNLNRIPQLIHPKKGRKRHGTTPDR